MRSRRPSYARLAPLSVPGRMGILAAVASEPGQGVKGYAARLGLPEAWVAGHLAALRRTRLVYRRAAYVVTTAGRYALGVAGRVETATEMRQLAEESKEGEPIR